MSRGATMEPDTNRNLRIRGALSRNGKPAATEKPACGNLGKNPPYAQDRQWARRGGMKISMKALTIAVTIALLTACSTTPGPQVTNVPSGSNGSSHGAPKNGMQSGPSSAQ
jgi:hypothetical protein